MRSLLVSIPSLLCMFACGGSIGKIDPGSLGIAGSYDFLIGDVTIVPETTEPIEPPMTGHPGIGQHARLDIRKNGDAYQAVLTPDFSDSSTMTVAIDADGNVVLTGSVAFSGSGGPDYSTSDEIDVMKLTVDGSGHFDGAWTASGREDVFEGDVGWDNNANLSGTLGTDSRAPQTRIAAGASLPWDTISVRVSEPVDAAALTNASSLTSTNGLAAMTWQVATTSDGADWIGAVQLSGWRTIWSDFSGDATFAIAAGLLDPSNNASSASSAMVHFMNVPSAPSFSNAASPAMWGATTIANGSVSCGGDGVTCFEMGPVVGPCNATPLGIAGRLPAAGMGHLSVTYRVRAASQYGGMPYVSGVALSVATPGQLAQTISDAQLSPQLAATNDTTYPYASDWITAVIALPQPGSEVGFSFTPFSSVGEWGGGCGGGGPALPPVTMVVDVTEVTLTP